MIALIHTLLMNPFLKRKGQFAVSRILLLVPVNTLANWQNEFQKWNGMGQTPSFHLYNFSDTTGSVGRNRIINQWYDTGGVLYCSSGTFSRLLKLGDDKKKKLQ